MKERPKTCSSLIHYTLGDSLYRLRGQISAAHKIKQTNTWRSIGPGLVLMDYIVFRILNLNSLLAPTVHYHRLRPVWVGPWLPNTQTDPFNKGLTAAFFEDNTKLTGTIGEVTFIQSPWQCIIDDCFPYSM